MTSEQIESKDKFWWLEEEEVEASAGVDISKRKVVLVR